MTLKDFNPDGWTCHKKDGSEVTRIVRQEIFTERPDPDNIRFGPCCYTLRLYDCYDDDSSVAYIDFPLQTVLVIREQAL